MTVEQMQRAMQLIAAAKDAKRKLTEFVLLKRDYNTQGETVQVGDPVRFRDKEWHRVNVPIPEAARQYVFRLWRKEVAQQFNAAVRELNQLGASHDFTLIEFSPVTGEPRI
jgi:hypothetical protein